MPESTTTPPTPVAARPSKPVSEALLNEKVCYYFLSCGSWSGPKSSNYGLFGTVIEPF
jgi:hypothetical protein